MSFSRMKEVVGVLFDFELHHFIHSLEVHNHLPFHKRVKVDKSDFATQPETIRKVFEELGGAFIKLGQLLALRPDLIGKDYSKEFEKLLMDIDPLPSLVVKNILNNKGFKNFNYKPLGCGSIAQVHKAKVLVNGKLKDVAVKIKKPNVEKVFAEDIKIMEFMAEKFKQKYNPTYFDPVDVVSEFKRYTEKELDLSHEASNIKIFYNNFKNSKKVKIPKVFDEISDSNILVMEYVEGKNILDIDKNTKQAYNVIRNVTDSVYKMLFEDRFFHADLHPGNVFVNKGKVIFLDYGIVGHIDKILEKKLFSLFSGLVNGDLIKTSDALVDLNIGNDEIDTAYLREGLYNVLESYYNTSMEHMDFSKIFYGSIEVARKSKLKMPANLILFGKSLVTMEGFCREVNPKFHIVKNAKPYLHNMMKKRFNPKNVAKKAKDAMFLLYEILNKLPETVNDAKQKFFMIEKRIIDIDNTFRSLTDKFWKATKLLVYAILFAVFFISGVILRNVTPLNSFFGFSYWTLVCFALVIPLLFNILGLLKD